MRIVISGSSCLTDLRKASLLHAFVKLPYQILAPNTLFEDDHLNLQGAQKQELIREGIKAVDLPGERVLRAQQLMRRSPQISVHDGFALALGEAHGGCILLTGDDTLRALATKCGIEVQGVLWVIDEIYANGFETAATLHAALRRFEEHPIVTLPARDLTAYIRRYERLR